MDVRRPPRSLVRKTLTRIEGRNGNSTLIHMSISVQAHSRCLQCITMTSMLTVGLRTSSSTRKQVSRWPPEHWDRMVSWEIQTPDPQHDYNFLSRNTPKPLPTYKLEKVHHHSRVRVCVSNNSSLLDTCTQTQHSSTMYHRTSTEWLYHTSITCKLFLGLGVSWTCTKPVTTPKPTCFLAAQHLCPGTQLADLQVWHVWHAYTVTAWTL